jgi:hypothetical protein
LRQTGPGRCCRPRPRRSARLRRFPRPGDNFTKHCRLYFAEKNHGQI